MSPGSAVGLNACCGNCFPEMSSIIHHFGLLSDNFLAEHCWKETTKRILEGHSGNEKAGISEVLMGEAEEKASV